MTLSTNLVVVDPINPERVFEQALSLLKRGVGFEPEWDHDPGKYVTKCGQGLPAWLFVHYAVDGPLKYHEDEDVEDYPDWQLPEWNEHCVRINVDTAYGYRGDGNASCSDLHAWFVSEMWAWLADQGAGRMAWSQEYTGEWYTDIGYIRELGDPIVGALS